MTESNPYLLNALLRRDFCSFLAKAFNTINPGLEYKHNWHIELIADYLAAVESGEIKRLIINLPPRNLKSISISVAWPAWILAHDPSKRILAASYSDMLSIKHSLDCRLIINSSWYQEIFPDTILSTKHNQKSKFLTTFNGFRFATSVGGSSAGEGGDYLIIDDPHNPIHIDSTKMRRKVLEWFEQTFVTRLNDKEKGAIILVMQRLHEEDLSGYLLANSSLWNLLKIPISAYQDFHYFIRSSSKFAYKQYSYYQGEILHPARDKEIDLLRLEEAMGSHNFVAQYLQEPLNPNSSLLKTEDIHFYEQRPKKFDYFILSFDTAIKISETSDYSVCLCFGIWENKYYLLGMERDKLTYPQLKRAALILTKQYAPKFILIEDKASGQQLIQDLRYDNIMGIIAIKPKNDKITRFASASLAFAAGQVLLPKQSHFNNVLLKELTSFPNSTHDDIVDSISQFINFMKEQPPQPIIRIRSFG